MQSILKKKKTLTHFCTETSLEHISLSLWRPFLLRIQEAFHKFSIPLTSMLRLALLKFSPRMVSLDVLFVLLLPLSHLLTVLFVCLHPLGWQQLLRFRTRLSAFLAQYSPPWSVHHIHYWAITLHIHIAHSKSMIKAWPLRCDRIFTYWPVISRYDPWHVKQHLKNWVCLFFFLSSLKDFPNTTH